MVAKKKLSPEYMNLLKLNQQMVNKNTNSPGQGPSVQQYKADLKNTVRSTSTNFDRNATEREINQLNMTSNNLKTYSNLTVRECPQPNIRHKQDNLKHPFIQNSANDAVDKFSLLQERNDVPQRPQRSKKHKTRQAAQRNQTDIKYFQFNPRDINSNIPAPILKTMLKPTSDDHKCIEIEDDNPNKSESDNYLPSRPVRSYRGRRTTPLTRALQPIKAHQYEEAFEHINHIINTMKNESLKFKDFKKIKEMKNKRTILSSLNLFLALSYEGLRDPKGVTNLYKHAINDMAVIVPQNMEEKSKTEENKRADKDSQVPTASAISQLKSSQQKCLYMKNVPTLLLFNLIYGRSI